MSLIGSVGLILLGLVLNIVAYLLLPRPKTEKPEAAQDGENPVASPGKLVPVVFGTVIIKETNILWYGDKNKSTIEIDA